MFSILFKTLFYLFQVNNFWNIIATVTVSLNLQSVEFTYCVTHG